MADAAGLLGARSASEMPAQKEGARAKAFLRINSESIGIEFCFEFLSFKYSQNDTFNLRHVFFREVKVSLLLRPSELLVPPLTLRLLAYSRISDSLALLCRGISGLSKTNTSSDLF